MIRHALLLIAALAHPAWADIYTLDAAASSVGFTASADGFRVTGVLPVARGAVRVNLGDVATSEIDVTVSTQQIRTGFVLVTSLVKGPALLDADSHPEMRFQARRIIRTGNTATVEGLLTVKAITRPITLQARFIRTADAPEAAPLARVGVQLTGSVDRRDFDILGYPGLVDDMIGIDVTAWMDRVDG
jgi:polyisoprenoid-binding protein YceI